MRLSIIVLLLQVGVWHVIAVKNPILAEESKTSSSNLRTVVQKGDHGTGTPEVDLNPHGSAFSVRSLVSPENDDCTGAIEISSDGQLVTGSTEEATTVVQEDFSDSCGFESISPGLWYSVVGNGDFMRADTCSNNTNFDTVISIYSGLCGNLQCVGFDDDGCLSLSSSVSWETEPSVTYYIRVHGYNATLTGQFGLKVSSFVPAVNHRCDGALALTLGGEVDGSMEGAVGNDGPVDCFYGFNEPSLWYFIDGTGAPLKISTCSPDSTFTGGMQVFKGSSCSELSCEGLPFEGNYYTDKECEFPSAVTTFFADEGVRYYVLLFGLNVTLGPQSTFTLTATEFTVASNDVCETALAISDISVPIIGSTYNALPDNVTCSYYNNYLTSGVWYSLIGTGAALEVSTCSSELNFDASIHIFSGTCEALECIAQGTYSYGTCDQSPYGSAKAVFWTTAGVEYLILVSGAYSSAIGDFALTITEAETPPNDLCADAIELIPDAGTIVGSMTDATGIVGMDNFCAYSYDAPTVWYSLTGTGDVYAISTCSSELNFDSGLTVSTGSCDSQQSCVISNGYSGYNCSDTNNSAARVVLRTQVGVEYLIYVQGLNYPAEGDFGLTVSTVQVPPNDECTGAIAMELNNGGAVVSGSIADATGFGGLNYSCAFSYDAPNVWYSLIGTGDVYAISTCSSDLNFDSGLSVSTGTCESQQCIVSNGYSGYNCSDTPYSAANVVFQTEVGVEYFIAIQGLNYPVVGDFTLKVSTIQPPPNNECSGAIVVDPSDGSVVGSITNATGFGGLDYSWCVYGYDAPTVWYSLIGTGDIYAISTCSSDLNFDSGLSISTGTCDNHECMAYSAFNGIDCTDTSFSAARVVLQTEVGVEYFIAVQGLNYPVEGDFTLKISTVEVPPNDSCAGASVIQPDSDNVVLGSTLNATDSGLSATASCGEPDESPDVWYRVEGTGTSLTASLCGETTTYDSMIAVFEEVGEDCNVACIVSNDDFCGLSSEVEWFAQTGVTYFIRVYGYGSSTGAFELRVA